ncbi:MAG: PLP-dependent aminotransferase family protein [Oscillospiraceae bacterium]
MDYIFSDKVSSLQPSVIREILKFTSDPEVISLAAGNPAPEAFPVKEIAGITAKLLADNPINALQYSVTEGYTPLRERLKERMKKADCFNEAQDELIITSGAQQANELACKVLLNEGDTLFCEAPSFIGSLNAFKSYNVDLVGIPMEEDGMKLEALEDALKTAQKPKLIYIIPNFQNPTGLCTSLEKRKAVYELAKKYGVMILEDNPYGDIRFAGENIPSIKTMDKDGIVIYSRTFSKTLAPGLRVGYVSAPKPVIQKMVVCKQVSDVHTNIMAQMICDEYLKNYDMDAHLEEIRAVYRHKCGLMLGEIDRNFSKKITVTRPEGGLFIWATLPEGSDMMGFCNTAVQKYKVAVVPGTAFLIHESEKTSSFRLNFSTPTDEQLVKGCEILGKLSKEMFD